MHVSIKGTLVAMLGFFCFSIASCGNADRAGIDDAPISWAELFGDELRMADGSSVGVEKLADKELVAIYFSAQWCPPCRTFTPLLVDATEELQEAGKSFEVVFVSADRSPREMFDYMESYGMPWPAIPYGSDTADALMHRFGVRGFPTLVVIDGDGKTITKAGRMDIASKGAAAYDDWLRGRQNRSR